MKKYSLTCDLGDGTTYDWEMVSPREIRTTDDLAHGPDAVELIGRFPNGDLLMVKEFRYPVNRFVYSFPTGAIDQNETVEEAVRRELDEETGLKVLSIDRILPPGYFAVGLTDEVIQTVHLTVDGTFGGHPDAMEEIIPVQMSKEQLKELLAEDHPPITLSALLVLDTLLNGL